jgi:hypothetical protein
VRSSHWAGPPLGFQISKNFQRQSLPITTPASRTLAILIILRSGTMKKKSGKIEMNQSDPELLLPERHVKDGQLGESAEVLRMTRVAVSHLNSLGLLNAISQPGSSGKMSPAVCLLTKEKILEPLSRHWGSAGMGSPTGFLTLDSTTCHKNGKECISLLAEILETGDIPHRYYLTKNSAIGLMRRSARRNRILPEPLKSELEKLAQSSTTTTDKTPG